MLNIAGRDVKGRTDSAYIQLRIISTCIPLLKRLRVHVSPEGYIVAVLVMINDTITPHTFKYVVLVGDRVKFRI